MVVISALGKTTNALEKVVEAFYEGDRPTALTNFATVKDLHNNLSIELIGNILPGLNEFYTEVEWLLHDDPVRNFDYYYDQVVCIGEMLSTLLVSAYLKQAGISNFWIDVRDVIRTDDNFRDALIDWLVTAQKIKAQIEPAFTAHDIVLTQGFIGATDENESTTLGREGSDFTAAVFANLLNAKDQTIWKDVQGVMNADPKTYGEAVWIKELNYREVIEMAYYGAQVIHPKTIKPLQNKGIPLYVKSFLYPQDPGTCIHNKPVGNLPSIIVHKQHQVLVQLTTTDFSFIGGALTGLVYTIFEKLKFRPNLTQNAAISMLCVMDDRTDKVEAFCQLAAEKFDVAVTRDLKLLTVRHYAQELVNKFTNGHRVVLQQQTPETIQVLMRDETL